MERNQRRLDLRALAILRWYNSSYACLLRRAAYERFGGMDASGQLSRLDSFLAYAESHRQAVSGIAAGLIALIAWVDWLLPTISIGFLYLFPVVLSAAALNTVQ